mgnify:CR=1 FL=1
MDAITNGATIEIVATGERFHTLNDWGLAIGNNDILEMWNRKTIMWTCLERMAFWISQKHHRPPHIQKPSDQHRAGR